MSSDVVGPAEPDMRPRGRATRHQPVIAAKIAMKARIRLGTF
jgi:hypothetical protein